jgi:hypothetical protein
LLFRLLRAIRGAYLRNSYQKSVTSSYYIQKILAANGIRGGGLLLDSFPNSSIVSPVGPPGRVHICVRASPCPGENHGQFDYYGAYDGKIGTKKLSCLPVFIKKSACSYRHNLANHGGQWAPSACISIHWHPDWRICARDAWGNPSTGVADPGWALQPQPSAITPTRLYGATRASGDQANYTIGFLDPGFGRVHTDGLPFYHRDREPKSN